MTPANSDLPALPKRMNLARVLQVYRYHSCITVRDLAKQIGVSAATLNRFEDGRGELSGVCLAKVLTWLLKGGRDGR